MSIQSPSPAWQAVAMPSVEYLESGVFVRDRTTWWHTPWLSFDPDPAIPWFANPIRAKTVLAVMISLEARHPLHRQRFWPARLTQVLRLLHCHPRVLSSEFPEFEVFWYAPLLVGCWLSLETVVRKHPELRFLLAPSVRRFLPCDLTEACEIAESAIVPKSNAAEIRKYFLGELVTVSAGHHYLGNYIGPLVTAHDLSLNFRSIAKGVKIDGNELNGVFYQMNKATSERPTVLPREVELLKQRIQENCAATLSDKGWSTSSKLSITVFDDDFVSWQPVWAELFGQHICNGFDLLAQNGMKKHDVLALLGEASRSRKLLDTKLRRLILERVCGLSALIIVDIRLLAAELESQASQYLSGLLLLEAIFHADEQDDGTNVPLIAFSSSRRQDIERWAYAAGADLFLLKPSSFQQVSDSIRLLSGLCVYLDPVYRILRDLLARKSAVTPTPRTGSVCQDLETEIRLVRNTVAPSLFNGLNNLVSDEGLQGRRGRIVRDSASILRALGNAFEDVSFGDGTLVLNHLRNMASHDTAVELTDPNDFPALGIAALSVAVDSIGVPSSRAKHLKDPFLTKTIVQSHRKSKKIEGTPRKSYIDDLVTSLSAFEWVLAHLPDPIRRKCKNGISVIGGKNRTRLRERLHNERFAYIHADDEWRAMVSRLCPEAAHLVSKATKASN